MVVVDSIGGVERINILLFRRGRIDQIDSAPCEAWLAELNSEQISYQARETPAAVRIGMNSHKRWLNRIAISSGGNVACSTQYLASSII